MLESEYQTLLIKRIQDILPGCLVLKNDSSYLQGIPDLTILYGKRWAMLEVKTSARARKQPNQTWYICEMNDMSFAAFIWPEIEEEVLHGLQQALRPRRSARVPQRV